MKRTIMVLRHAQAVSSHAGGDFHRKLTDHGIRQAQQVAAHLKSIAWRPELALVSAAKRTMQTAEIIVKHFENIELIADRNLYLAEGTIMIDVLSSMPDHITNLLLVGHNPGISEVPPLLTGNPHAFVLATAGFTMLSTTISSWQQLQLGCAKQA
jgi:phosphohistidine phosphatase